MSTASQTRVRAQSQTIPGHVLVVSGQPEFSDDFVTGLERAALATSRMASGAAALASVAEEPPDVVLLPESLQDMTGPEFLGRLSQISPDCPVVIVLADGLDSAAEVLELGAADFMVDPCSLEQAVATLSLVVVGRSLQRENETLRRRLNDLKSGDALIGCSPASRRLSGVLARVAESSATVLIEGHKGSGKSLAAQIIHASSRRSEKQLVIELCDSLTCERFAEGLESIDGGTLLLEDVEALHPDVQSKLVRYLKERSARAGNLRDENLRIIATTSAHLPELVARGKFREDLFYRLNVFPIVIPTLQERRDDVASLARYFLENAERRSGVPTSGFTTEAMILLETHPWPGNVAQLQDVIHRAETLARGDTIDRHHLLGPSTGLSFEPAQPELPRGKPDTADEDVREEDILPLESEEKRLLARALKATKGNVRRAAQLLRIGRATLYRKIQIYDLKLN